jgi:hypothetical protein
MKEFTPNTTRPWKVVAAEVANETDPTRLSELIVELEQALSDQGIGKPLTDFEPPANPSSSTER